MCESAVSTTDAVQQALFHEELAKGGPRPKKLDLPWRTSESAEAVLLENVREAQDPTDEDVLQKLRAGARTVDDEDVPAADISDARSREVKLRKVRADARAFCWCMCAYESTSCNRCACVPLCLRMSEREWATCFGARLRTKLRRCAGFGLMYMHGLQREHPRLEGGLRYRVSAGPKVCIRNWFVIRPLLAGSH